MKVITDNKKAYFDYHIEEKYEAGIALKGSEVKSLKLGDISLRDSFCHIFKEEVWLKNCHITPYSKGSFYNEEARRDRKLLLHRQEIKRLIGKIKQKGYTLVPLKVYFSNNRAKLEIGLAKGKKLYDKRESIKEREQKRSIERDLKQLNT